MNITNVGYRSTNYYVLGDRTPRLLVDAGWPGMLPALQHSCDRMGTRLESIPYQLVTHYHPDHAGLSQELKRLGIRLVVVETQVEHIDKMLVYTKPTDNYTAITPDGNIEVSVEASRAFLAGIGLQGEIISTPGHSDDSVTLVLDTGEAFTGDLTSPRMVPDDPADPAYRSWQLIRAKGATIIYPGHGPSFSLDR